MRNTYVVECPLSSSPDPNAVARLWHAWLAKSRNGPKLPKALLEAPAVDLASTEVGTEQQLEQIRVDEQGLTQFALRWEHPDARSAGVRWRVELAYISAHDDQSARFSCKLAVGRSIASIAPTRRATTRPKIVVDMLKAFPGVEVEPIAPLPLVLRATDAARFAAFLTAEDRKRPIVLVTCRNVDDRPAVDPSFISDILAGLAFVYVTDGRWPSLALRDHLPRHLICRDGAVRLYWPGFATNGDGYGHPFWIPGDLRRLDSEKDGGLPQLLLESIVEAANYTSGTHVADWQRFESSRRRVQIAESRAAGDFEKLAESYAADNVALREQKEDLEEALRTAGDDLRQARNDTKYWRGEYEAVMSGTRSTQDEQEAEIGSVADALDRAIQKWPTKLILALNSASDKDTPFAAPGEVYASVRFLATTFHDSKSGTKSCSDLDRELREQTGWTYEANQSVTTMGKHRGEYECTWDGRRHTLKAHMGTGTSKDPRHTIRIAFAWDEKRQVVVVGFVGQHQSSDRT